MLVRYEMRKLFGGKTKWLLIFIIFLNIFLYYLYLMPDMKTDEERDFYRKVLDKGDTYASLEDAYKYLENDVRYYAGHGGASRVELSESEYNVRQELEKEYRDALETEAFLKEYDKRAENMLGFSIFSKEDSFSFRNIKKTADDFRNLSALKITPADGSGLLQMQDFVISDLFVLVLISLFSFQLSGIDTVTGINKVIHATPKGEKRLIFIRSGIISVCGVVCALCIYGSNILQTGIFAGLPDWSTDIHGIEAFRNIPYECTTEMYLLLYLAWKAFYVCAASWFIQWLVCKVESAKTIWLLIGGAMTGSFLLWFYLPSGPVTKIFRYLNLVGLADTAEIIGNYQNLNFFGYPVELRKAAVCVMIAASAGGILLALYMRPVRLKALGKRTKRRLPAKCRRGVFLYEAYKILGRQKGGLLLAAVLAFSIYNGFLDKEPDYLSREEYYYEQMSARLLDKKGDALEEAMRRLEAEETDLSEEGKGEAMFRIQRQYAYLAGQHEESLEYVNARVWENMLFNRSDDLILYLVFVIAMAFFTNGLFRMEYRSRMHTLLKTTREGEKVYWYKLLVVGMAGGIFVLLIHGGQLIKYFQMYETGKLDWPAKSLPKLADFPGAMSIKGVLLLEFGQKIAGGILIGAMFFLLAQALASVGQFMAVSALLFVLPGILLYIANMTYNNPLVNILERVIEPRLQVIYGFSSWLSVYKDIPLIAFGIMILGLALFVICGYRSWLTK